MMKKLFFAVLTALSIGAIGCSSSSSTEFDKDGEKALKTLIKAQYLNDKHQEFSEVKLIRDVTVEDSLNFELNSQNFQKIIEDYNKRLENIKYQISKTNDPVYATPESWLQQNIDQLNQFADAFDGKFSDDLPNGSLYKHVFRLKNLPKDQVLAKVYSVTYKRIKAEKWITNYWILKPDFSGTYLGVVGAEYGRKIPKSSNNLEQIHFERFVR